jgi:catechol 2,3-dioxygenase-like lactoylglutathione lyase family enzyme
LLKDKNVAATIAVKNIDVAGKFYEGKLGLERVPVAEKEVLTFRSGDSRVLVYVSEFAGTNKATAATWAVGEEIEQIVADLKGKGISFEHYNMPGMKLQGDIHVAGSMKAAWFKDPDGNILALVNG